MDSPVKAAQKCSHPWPGNGDQHRWTCATSLFYQVCVFNQVLGFIAQLRPSYREILSAEGKSGFGAWADFWRYISKLKIPQVWRPPKYFPLVDVFILNKAKAAQFSVPHVVGLGQRSKGQGESKSLFSGAWHWDTAGKKSELFRKCILVDTQAPRILIPVSTPTS